MLAGSKPAPYCALVRKSEMTCAGSASIAVDAACRRTAPTISKLWLPIVALIAELVTRRADVGRALVGERLPGIEGAR